MISFFLIAFLSAQPAHAIGDTETHGGHAVVCDEGRRTELLDLYESRGLYSLTPSLLYTDPVYYDDYSDVYVDDAINEARNRAEKVLGPRHPFLEIFKARNVDINNLVTGDPIGQSHDWGHVLYPIDAGCSILQAAERIGRGRDVEINVDPLFWMNLPLDDKTALVLHEILHDWFGSNTTTVATRQAVIYLSAPHGFRKANASAFKKLVETRRPVSSFRSAR